MIGRHLSCPRVEAFEAPQIGLARVRRLTAVDHAAALLLSLQELLLDGRRRLSIAKIRDEAVATTLSATTPQEAGKAVAILVGKVAGLCSGLTATACADPATAAQIEASADDAFLIVRQLSSPWTLDVAIGSTTQRPFAVARTSTVIAETTTKFLALVGAKNRLDSVAIVTIRPKVSPGALIPIEGLTTTKAAQRRPKSGLTASLGHSEGETEVAV